MIGSRRLAVGAFASVGAVLLVAGTAFACVPFKGSARVDSSNTGSVDSGTVVGNGTSSSMRYCGDTVTPGSTTVTAAENKGGDVITVTVGGGSCASPGADSALAQGSNTVIINNATVAADSPFSITGTTKSVIQGKGCFTSPNPNGNKTLGSVSVDGTGDAAGTFTLPTMNSVDGASRISALCVGRAGSDGGIFVPIKITATTGGGL